MQGGGRFLFTLGMAAGGAVIARWPGRQPSPAHPDALLLRVVCHELRTPVRSLRSLTRALNEEATADRTAVAQLACQQAAHVESLLDQVTAAAQGLLGGPPDDERVPVGRLLPSVAATVPGDRLRLRVSERAARRRVAARRTRQILTNLLDNAVRHGPPGGPVRLDVAVRSGWLVLTVRDEGRDSRPVEAALRRRTPPVGVTGLGLWIVRQLAAADGGRVTAHRDREGLAVRVRLPARSARARG